MSSYVSAFFIDTESSIDPNDNVGMGIDPAYVGFYICIWASAYTISAFVVGPLAKKYTPQYVSLFSYLLISVGCICFGPSKILQIYDQNKNYIECAGYNAKCLEYVNEKGLYLC